MSCTPDRSGIRGVCELKCGKVNRQGVARVSLKITPFDGKRISYRATAVSLLSYGGGDGSVAVKWGGYQVTIRPDGTFLGGPVSDEEGFDCAGNAVWSERIGGKMSGAKAYFTMVDLEPFDLWDGRKALPSLMPGAGCGNYGNLSCLRLSYNVKRGLFKGTFKIYATKQYVNECWMESASKPQLKKVGVKVIGAVIGGEGIGSSVTPNSCARPPIHFRCRVTTQNPAEQYYW